MLQEKLKTHEFELEDTLTKLGQQSDPKKLNLVYGTEIDEELDSLYLSKEQLFLNIYFANQLYAGIPLGFVQSSLPILLVKKGAKLSHLGFLSLCNYPFCFKFLFGPILDRFFSERIGKRMSYILPCLVAILLLSAWSGFFIEQWIQSLNLALLTWMGFFMMLSAAVLIIASDGYLVTIVAKDRRSLMPMLKSVAQVVGMALSYNLFIPLNSLEFCNKYIYSIPKHKPLLTYEVFFVIVAASLVLYISFVAFCPVKEPPTRKNFGSILEIVKMVKGFWTNKNLFRSLMFFILWTMGFAPLDNYLVPACIGGGFSEALFTNIQTMIIPVSIIATCLTGSYALKGIQHQFRLFYWHIVTKIASSLFAYWILIEYDTPEKWQNAFWVMTLQQTIDAIQDSMLSTASGAFFASICDHRIGTTYLTVIFSVMNLGGFLPRTIMLYTLSESNWKLLTYISWGYTIALLFVVISQSRKLSSLPLEEFGLNAADTDSLMNKVENQDQLADIKTAE